MSGLQRQLLLFLTFLVFCSCATTKATKSSESHFYKSEPVRECLQVEKKQEAKGSNVCWEQLLQRIESDPEFTDKEQYSPSDLLKIRKMANRSEQHSTGLAKELDACFNLPAGKGEEREQCFSAFLDRHKTQLSRAEKVEIENVISTVRETRQRSLGNIDATIEHAGKLLGGQIHSEDDGIRIDSISEGPLRQAQVQEQGLIMKIDDRFVSTLDASEHVALLEACEERTLALLIRYGGRDNITFDRIEVRCDRSSYGKRVEQTTVPVRTCTGSESPEVRLGISWCYSGEQGILEVQWVCDNSPASDAGVQVGQRYTRINTTPLLGLGYPQIGQWISRYPEQPLSFQELSGTLSSPAVLSLPPLNTEWAGRCFQSIPKAAKPKGITAEP
jgi:hypothetical protein